MFDLLTKALEALAGYPIIQAAVAILVIFAGIFIMRRGERDRKSGGNGSQLLPAWTLYGPAHDAMKSIHNISENNRAMVKTLEVIAAESRVQTLLLEDIRNNQVMRTDLGGAQAPPPVRRK